MSSGSVMGWDVPLAGPTVQLTGHCENDRRYCIRLGLVHTDIQSVLQGAVPVLIKQLVRTISPLSTMP